MFTNGGPSAVRDGSWTGVRIPDLFPKGGPIKDVALGDLDRDGDLDIVVTFPEAATANVRWYRNPVVDNPNDAFNVSTGAWQVGLIGQIPTGADTVMVRDIDGDFILDVVVRSTDGGVIQWLRGVDQPTTSPTRSSPWQVFTIAEFSGRAPGAVNVADLNRDGQPDVIASAGGGIAWFNATNVFDQWAENLIIDDDSPGTSGDSPATTDPNVSPGEVAGKSFVNTILIVDLDGDGVLDFIATLDRDGLSGISNDALVWFRNTSGG